MKTPLASLVLASLLAIGASLPGHAQDAAKPAEAAPAISAPAAAKPDAPANVARPSIAPKTAEPAPTATFEPAPHRHRRAARRHYRRYGYWEPFPVYLPHFHRHRVHWNRIPWFLF